MFVDEKDDEPKIEEAEPVNEDEPPTPEKDEKPQETDRPKAPGTMVLDDEKDEDLVWLVSRRALRFPHGLLDAIGKAYGREESLDQKSNAVGAVSPAACSSFQPDPGPRQPTQPGLTREVASNL